MKVKIVCIKDFFETTFAQSPKFKKGEMYPAEFKNNNVKLFGYDDDSKAVLDPNCNIHHISKTTAGINCSIGTGNIGILYFIFTL